MRADVRPRRSHSRGPRFAKQATFNAAASPGLVNWMTIAAATLRHQ